MTKKYWEYGQRSYLAKLVDIQANVLSDILYRRRSIGKHLAKKLAKNAEKMGFDIPIEAWLFNDTTKHPAFFNKPHRQK